METDSISEKEHIIDQIRNMLLNCKHEWVYNHREDNYRCEHCDSTTKLEATKDWLNGETENHDIDLTWLEEL